MILAMLPACSKHAAGVATTAPPPVRIALVRLANVPVELKNIGVVQPVSSVTIQAQVNGVIDQVLIKPGADVRKGEVLFTIDKSPFAAAVSQAQANLAQARANVDIAIAKLQGYQAAYVDASADWKRAQKLGTSGGALAITQYDAYHSTYDQAKANVANGTASLVSARGAVASAEAGRTTAMINLGYCTIRSPLNGKAGNLQAFVGTNVQASTTNLLVINQMQPIYVSFSLPQSDLYQILNARQKNSRLPVYATVHDAPGPQVKGYLSFIDNSIDDSTGSIQLMGTFSNKRKNLWPNEFVDATLQVALKKNAVVVPIQAVQTGQNGAFAFILKDNIAQMRPVTEAFSYNDMAVIAKGLRAGETVITDGQVSVIPGKAVEVVTKGLIAPIPGPHMTSEPHSGAPTTNATSPANKGQP
jgi:multidrug efflux system membrane fusion protein